MITEERAREVYLRELEARSMGFASAPMAAHIIARDEAAIAAMMQFAALASAQLSDTAQDGYQQAFYTIGDLLAINAQTRSPKDVWETDMLPRLRALIALKQAVSAQPSDTAQAGSVEQAREALGPADDWTAKLAEMQDWTGSAFMAGEESNKPQQGLYSFLCGVLGFLTAGEDAARALAASPRSPNDDMQSVEREREGCARTAARYIKGMGGMTPSEASRGVAHAIRNRPALTRPDEAPTVDKRGEGA